MADGPQTFILTTKEETKTLPCVYPGCENSVVVNKFYTPAKARCPLHAEGRIPPSIAQADSPVVAGPPTSALTNLACPRHPDVRMKVISTASRFSNGITIELQCPTCFILVKIDTSWNRAVPPKSYVGEPTWPDWFAYEKSRVCPHGDRIAAFRHEDPIIAAQDGHDRAANPPKQKNPKRRSA